MLNIYIMDIYIYIYIYIFELTVLRLPVSLI